MSKKSTKQNIVINCDSPEVFNALLAMFHTHQADFTQQLGTTLKQAGIENDPTFEVQPDGSIKASKRSYDKGQVITTPGGQTIAVKPYKELEKGAIYSLPNQGTFAVFIKLGTGIDKNLGHFRNWNDLVTNLSGVTAPAETPVAPEIETKADMTVVE